MTKVSLLAVDWVYDSVDVLVDTPSITKPSDARCSLPPTKNVDTGEDSAISTIQWTGIEEVTEQPNCSCSFTGTRTGPGPGCSRNTSANMNCCYSGCANSPLENAAPSKATMPRNALLIISAN